MFLAGVSFDAYGLAKGISIKQFFGYLSVAITLTGYLIYLAEMYPDAGRVPVRPEPLTWALFGFLTAAAWVIQVSQGGAAGSWCLGTTAFACILISAWSYLRFRWVFGYWQMVVAASAALMFTLSVLARTYPTLATTSAIFATLADLLSYGPTFRRAWLRPQDESATNFAVNSIKCIPALLALDTYSVATTVYLIMLTIVNAGFASFLLIRRGQIRSSRGPKS